MSILFEANSSSHSKPASKRFLRRKVSSTSLKVFFTSFWSSAVVLYILNTRPTRSGVVLWKYNSSNFVFTNRMNNISLITTITSLEPQKKNRNFNSIKKGRSEVIWFWTLNKHVARCTRISDKYTSVGLHQFIKTIRWWTSKSCFQQSTKLQHL